MSLRARLLASLVGLVAAGLLVSGTLTVTALRSFLTDRVDRQLEDARPSVERALHFPDGTGIEGRRGPGPEPRGPSRTLLPPGTYGELREPDGAVVTAVVFNYEEAAAAAPPDLPGRLPDGPFTVGAVGGGSLRYRVLAETLPEGDGAVIVAVPLRDVAQTLARLAAVEAVVTVAVLAALALLARWVVGRGLRPLEEIGETAGAIAAGDLSRRATRTPPTRSAASASPSTPCSPASRRPSPPAGPRRNGSAASWRTHPTSFERRSPQSAATPSCFAGEHRSGPRTWPRPCAGSRTRHPGWGSWSTTCSCWPASTRGASWSATRSTWRRSPPTPWPTPGRWTRAARSTSRLPARSWSSATRRGSGRLRATSSPTR